MEMEVAYKNEFVESSLLQAFINKTDVLFVWGCLEVILFGAKIGWITYERALKKRNLTAS